MHEAWLSRKRESGMTNKNDEWKTADQSADCLGQKRLHFVLWNLGIITQCAEQRTSSPFEMHFPLDMNKKKTLSLDQIRYQKKQNLSRNGTVV